MCVNGKRYSNKTLNIRKIPFKFWFDHAEVHHNLTDFATEFLRDKTYRINTLNLYFSYARNSSKHQRTSFYTSVFEVIKCYGIRDNISMS